MPPVSKFWRENEERLKRLAESGLSDKEIAGILGKTVSAVTTARNRFGVPGGTNFRDCHLTALASERVISETPERAVIAPGGTADEPIEELWDRAIRHSERKNARAAHEGVALVRIVSAVPISISLSSDWHVSLSGSCDLEGLREYARATQQAPGAYALAVGDLYDNPVKWSRNMEEIPDEVRLVDDLFGTFGLKLLGTTDGNHDAWARQFAGLDAIKGLAERHRVHYAPDELTYVVEILSPATRERTARYVVATRHKFRRNSNLNWTHACWRYLEERVGQWPQLDDGAILVPDIVAIGDNHLAAVERRDFANGPKWAARMGPWQLGSDYARAKGFAGCPPTAPTFILYPDGRPAEGNASYVRAYELLAAQQDQWRKAA